MQPVEVADLTQALALRLKARGWMLVTAESCTGGLIAKTCTDLAGSSAWFERGLVTYSNQAKTDLLGVSGQLIESHGAVSQAVAEAMASGALVNSPARISVAVTGIAGPDGGSDDKPVGTVWFGFATNENMASEKKQFVGNREAVRQQTLIHALRRLIDLLD